MVKHHVANSVFNFAWNQVACAFLNRYPNPHSNHVLSEDIIHQEIVNGNLVVKKLITKTNKIPKWCEKFIRSNAKRVYMVEESLVDPVNHTFVTYIRNVTMTSLLLVGEKTIFSPCLNSTDSSSLNNTLCQRIGWAESRVRIIGVGRPIEAMVMDRFRKNLKSTTKGLEHVLDIMFPSIPITEATISSTSPTVQIKEKAREAKERAKQAKDLATRAGQKVVTSYTRKTAA